MQNRNVLAYFIFQG